MIVVELEVMLVLVALSLVFFFSRACVGSRTFQTLDSKVQTLQRSGVWRPDHTSRTVQNRGIVNVGCGYLIFSSFSKVLISYVGGGQLTFFHTWSFLGMFHLQMVSILVCCREICLPFLYFGKHQVDRSILQPPLPQNVCVRVCLCGISDRAILN